MQQTWFRRVAFVILLLGVLTVVFGLLTRHKTKTTQTSPASLEWVTLATSPVGSVGLTQSQVVIMERMYQEDIDVDVAKTLLHHYTSQWDYQKARDMLMTMQEKKQLALLDQQIVQLVAYNAAYNGKETDLLSSPLVSDTDWRTASLLSAIAQERYGDVDIMITDSLQTKDPTPSPLWISLQQAKKTFATLQAAPSYYYTGLLAAALMEGGYLPYAQALAERVLENNPWYILAHEILSQAAIKQWKYDQAIKHLKELISLDRQHLQRTSFFLWLALYNVGQIDEASLYFQQVNDPIYKYDALRYMLLIAYQEQSFDRMMDMFRTLLQDKKATTSDYLLLYDIVFYEPYRRTHQQTSWETYSLAQQYALSIIVPYIDSCRKYLISVAPYVCKYGEAGWYISQGKLDKAILDLVSVSKSYPNPRIFHAIWDYYLAKWNKKTAETFYKKSLLRPQEISRLLSPEPDVIYSWNTAGE